MLDVIIESANDGLIYLFFDHKSIQQVRLVLQRGEVGEIDQFSLTVCSFLAELCCLVPLSLLDWRTICECMIFTCPYSYVINRHCCLYRGTV